MSCSLKAGFSVSGSNKTIIKNKSLGYFGVSPSTVNLQFSYSKSTDVIGKPLQFSDQKIDFRAPKYIPPNAQATSRCISRALRWWEKTLMPNMIEIYSAQELVDSLLIAGDRLVIIDFYSPGCGGCKSLHPKICQLAELNPGAIFLKVNYEELKTMCHSLHIHVLPFFRFYRGAEGKLCSFSCTNATVTNMIRVDDSKFFTKIVKILKELLKDLMGVCLQIKKFKDALAKYGTERCTLGPPKGLEESELLALASNGLISKKLLPNLTEECGKSEELLPEEIVVPNGHGKEEAKIGFQEGNAVVMA